MRRDLSESLRPTIPLARVATTRRTSPGRCFSCAATTRRTYRRLPPRRRRGVCTALERQQGKIVMSITLNDEMEVSMTSTGALRIGRLISRRAGSTAWRRASYSHSSGKVAVVTRGGRRIGMRAIRGTRPGRLPFRACSRIVDLRPHPVPSQDEDLPRTASRPPPCRRPRGRPTRRRRSWDAARERFRPFWTY